MAAVEKACGVACHLHCGVGSGQDASSYAMLRSKQAFRLGQMVCVTGLLLIQAISNSTVQPNNSGT